MGVTYYKRISGYGHYVVMKLTVTFISLGVTILIQLASIKIRMNLFLHA